MGCSACKKKKVVEQLPEPIDETLVDNDRVENIKRLDFIFNSRYPNMEELKILWKKVFDKELIWNFQTSKQVFQNYVKTNNIVL